MEDKKKVTLEHPVSIDQEDGSKKVYSEVFVGRLKNKHLKMLPKDFFEKGGKIPPAKVPGIISAICEIPLKVADEIDVDDTWKIMEELEHFFDKSQTQTGSSTSG